LDLFGAFRDNAQGAGPIYNYCIIKKTNGAKSGLRGPSGVLRGFLWPQLQGFLAKKHLYGSWLPAGQVGTTKGITRELTCQDPPQRRL